MESGIQLSPTWEGPAVLPGAKGRALASQQTWKPQVVFPQNNLRVKADQYCREWAKEFGIHKLHFYKKIQNNQTKNQTPNPHLAVSPQPS